MDQDRQEEEADKEPLTRSKPLLGPLEEEIRVEAGEILAGAEVTQEEAEIPEEEGEILEGEEEIPSPYMTNFQDNNPTFSKGTGESRRPSCKNGTSTMGSIDILPK